MIRERRKSYNDATVKIQRIQCFYNTQTTVVEKSKQTKKNVKKSKHTEKNVEKSRNIEENVEKPSPNEAPSIPELVKRMKRVTIPVTRLTENEIQLALSNETVAKPVAESVAESVAEPVAESVTGQSSQQLLDYSPEQMTTNHASGRGRTRKEQTTMPSSKIDNATILCDYDMDLTVCAPETVGHSSIAPTEPITGIFKTLQNTSSTTTVTSITSDSGIESSRVETQNSIVHENGQMHDAGDSANMRASTPSTNTFWDYDIPVHDADFDFQLDDDQAGERGSLTAGRDRPAIINDTNELNDGLSAARNIGDIERIKSIQFSDVESDIQTHAVSKKRRAIVSSTEGSLYSSSKYFLPIEAVKSIQFDSDIQAHAVSRKRRADGSSTQGALNMSLCSAFQVPQIKPNDDNSARNTGNGIGNSTRDGGAGLATSVKEAECAIDGNPAKKARRDSTNWSLSSSILRQIDGFVAGLNEPTAMDQSFSIDTPDTYDEFNRDENPRIRNGCVSVTDSLHVHIPKRSQVVQEDHDTTVGSPHSVSRAGTPVNSVKEPGTSPLDRVMEIVPVAQRTSNIEESEDDIERSESLNSSIFSGPTSSCAFRVRLLRNSANTENSNSLPTFNGTINNTSTIAAPTDASNWLVHKSCSNNSMDDEVTCSNGSSKPDGLKVFPESSKIVYSNYVDCSPLKVAVNHFGDPSVTFHLLGRFSRYDHLNANFNGIIFTTGALKRIIMRYQNVKNENVEILHYNETKRFDHVAVTAIEVPNYPGGAVFLIENLAKNISILHAGEHRLPIEIDENMKLADSEPHYIYFDPSILKMNFYRFPPDADRYMSLVVECQKFVLKHKTRGFNVMIAVGTFEIGMEFLLLRLSQLFGPIWMNQLRQTFVRFLGIDICENARRIIRPLVRRLAKTSSAATIHVLDVNNIHPDYLSTYLNYEQHGNFNAVLAIRPRGCEFQAQQIFSNKGTIKIIDVSNPLIGEIEEYDRFVCMTLEKNRKVLEHVA